MTKTTKKELPTIRGTMQRVKDPNAILSEYIKVPHTIFNYVELGLLSGNALLVWLKLYQFYNTRLGYSFPTQEQLCFYTNLNKKTVIKAIDELERVGLITTEKNSDRKGKRSPFSNNIYYVYEPLGEDELYGQVPELLTKLEKKKTKHSIPTERDKAWNEMKGHYPYDNGRFNLNLF